MVRLTKEEIKEIDEFLKRHHVKFIDVRLELIDHLATDYEMGLHDLKLHAFLMSKRYFIKEFMNKRQKSIHWSYQKQLYKQVASFFYKLKYIVFTLIIVFVLFAIKAFQNETLILWGFILSTVLPLVLALYKQIKSSKFKKLQSHRPIGAIMALPSLFLYSFSQAKSYLPTDDYGFYMYWFVALLFGISGLIVFNRIVFKIEDDYTKIISA